ncbi:MAG: ZIP family zinc transporter [Bradymonadia bacterium]|jgi:ZIP family zinc transporter
MLGFTAGVMIAASFWSLLAPAIEMTEVGPVPTWVPDLVGFPSGGAFLWVAERLPPHVHLDAPDANVEGIGTE